jgi:hypothetical protein
VGFVYIDKEKGNKFVNSVSSINRLCVNTNNDSQVAYTPRSRVNSNLNILQSNLNLSTPRIKNDTLGRLKGLKERTVKILDKYLKEVKHLKNIQ